MNSRPIPINDDNHVSESLCLFQFWDKKIIPTAVEELTKGVASVNSSLRYQMFDDVTAADFIEKEYGGDTLSLYNSCAIPAMRADFFRYCYLAKHGGMYIDADFPAVASIEPLVSSQAKGCLYLRERGLTNSMMYFREPGDSLAEKILEVAIHNVASRSSNNVWQVTGPNVLQALYADDATSMLFDGIHFIDEAEFAKYFKLAVSLDYKQDDSHWFVARKKGLNIFRD